MSPVYRSVSPTGLQKALQEDKSKLVKNMTGTELSPYRVVAWTNTGTVELASALDVSITDIAGITNETIANTTFGKITQGGTIPDILVGMNAVPGQIVYLSAVPGELTLTPPTTPGSTVIKVGKAEPPSGGTGLALDLLIELELLWEN